MPIQQFIQAETWIKPRQVVHDHPELLSEEAGALLSQMLEAAQQQGNEDDVRVLRDHQALLQRCRDIGMDQAFVEKMGLSSVEELEAATEFGQLTAGVRAVLQELTESGVEINSPENLERLLVERPDLQEKLAANLPDTGSVSFFYSNNRKY